MYNILIIDDEKSMLDVIEGMLGKKNYTVFKALSGREALDIIRRKHIDAAVCDIKMAPMSGMDILKEAHMLDSDIQFIMISAYGSIEDAVEAMRCGAYHYIVKPFKMNDLRMFVERALEHKALAKENVILKKQLYEKYGFDNIVGTSGAMRKVYDILERVAPTDSTVLISGESGTGKELAAKAIHFHSARKNSRFVAINCGGLPETLLESELFGYVKGAFTGAASDKTGLFQAADGGTIFLDEISATSPGVQVKLLRVLQEKEIKRVGDTRNIPVDARVIAATNKRLDTEVKKGLFREDLYYRLSVIPVSLPPLRERQEDIPLLVRHFLKKHGSKDPVNTKRIEKGVIDIFEKYNWPGNVRELENIIERAVTLCEGNVITRKDIPDSILACVSGNTEDKAQGKLKDIMRRKEKEYINYVLAKTGGNKKNAARILGIDLATLYRKINS